MHHTFIFCALRVRRQGVWIHVPHFMHIIWRDPAVIVHYSILCFLQLCAYYFNILCHRLCICAFSLSLSLLAISSNFILFQAILWGTHYVGVCVLPFDVYYSLDKFHGRATCIGKPPRSIVDNVMNYCNLIHLVILRIEKWFRLYNKKTINIHFNQISSCVFRKRPSEIFRFR